MVLSKISTYFSDSKKKIIDLLSRKPLSSAVSGFCCINITTEELIFVKIRESETHRIIDLCLSYPYTNKNNLFTLLSNIVKEHQIKNALTSLVLQSDDYQLIVTDALPVAVTEFQAAIRWKIKDLLKFPIDDVVIDSFPVPKTHTAQNKIMVIAARASELIELSEAIQQCGLKIRSISVPEIGLLAITNLYADPNAITTCIYIQDTYIQLLMIAHETIYVSRQLKFTINTENELTLEQSINHLAAELQRSFDYYHSLWPSSAPMQLILAATKSISKEAIEQLSETIRMPIQIINLMQKFESTQKLDVAEQGKFLMAIGGALAEKVDNETND